MALFATTTTSDNWGNCGTNGYSPCPVSTSSSDSSSTPLPTTIESSTAWASASAFAPEPKAPRPEPRPMTSSLGYILIGVAITIVIILIGAGIFYWRRRRRAAAAAAPPPDPVFPPIEKNESDAEKGYADVRLDTAVSELDPGPGGMGKVFIAELDGSSVVGGRMELDSSPVMAVSPIAGVKSNLFISSAATNVSTRSRFAPSTYSVAGTTASERGGNGFSGAGTGMGAGAGAGVGTSVSNNSNNNNTFVAELEAPMSASEVDKSIELEGNAAPQITEVEIPSSILFTVKKSSSGED